MTQTACVLLNGNSGAVIKTSSAVTSFGVHVNDKGTDKGTIGGIWDLDLLLANGYQITQTTAIPGGNSTGNILIILSHT